MARFGLKTVKIVGISINSTTLDQVLRVVVREVKSGQKLFMVTPNPEFIAYAQAHSWFKKILNKADIAIPDGIGLVWASRLLRNTSEVKPSPNLENTSEVGPEIIQERISGTDLMEELCRIAAKEDWTVYLLGGQPGIAKETLRILKKRYPGLKGWAEAGPNVRHLRGEARLKPREHLGGEWGRKWIKKINQRKPTFLFVAFGMGKQEKFIWDNWNRLDVRLAMGVGGAFDYLSGQVPRAPKWVQKAGLEWFFRLLRQPWRIRRQLALIKFIWLVLKEKRRQLVDSFFNSVI